MISRVALCAAVLALPIASPVFAAEPTVVAVISHPVADYDAWRPYYDKWEPARREAGMVSQTVLRGADDPNAITLIHSFETMEGAQSLLASPALKADMAEAGVLGKPAITIGVIAD